MNLELTQEEQDLLVELLEEDLQALREEIMKTDSHDFRETLKAREQTLAGLLGKARAGRPV